MNYVYYVVYERWIQGKAAGKGCCEAFPDKPITSLEQIKDIEQGVRQLNNWPEHYMVLILDYKFLRTEEAADNEITAGNDSKSAIN